MAERYEASGKGLRLVPRDKLWLTGDKFPTLKAFVEGLGVLKVVVGQLAVLAKVGDAGTIAALRKRGGRA